MIDGKNIIYKTKICLEMIKFEHTVFALPFAYLGTFWATRGLPKFAQFGWITLAMVGARTFSMSLNRIIDKEIDAKNPRTEDRALPKKLLTVCEVGIVALASLALFLYAVYNLSPLAHYLWPAILLPLTLYPYAKRFTRYANLTLGLCLALAPLSAWIAINNSIGLIPVLLALGVFFWVSGFDIIYACQDVEIDHRDKLHSIPADLGIPTGLLITKVFYILSIGFFTTAGILSKIHPVFYIGVFVGALLLYYESSIISPNDLSRVNQAFFTVNSFYSVTIFTFTLIAFLA